MPLHHSKKKPIKFCKRETASVVEDYDYLVFGKKKVRSYNNFLGISYKILNFILFYFIIIFLVSTEPTENY